jgi:hypothetical protein
MPGRIFSRSLLQAISDSSCELRLLSEVHRPTASRFESTTTSQLHLPEVWTPAAQYLIGAGLRPALAQRLSDTYVDFVARHRKLFESYFNRAMSKGCNLSTECYRDAFIVQFKRAIQVWDSQFVSIVRVWIRQAGVPPVAFRPEHVNASTIVPSKVLAMLNPSSHRYALTMQRKPKSLQDSDLKQRILLPIR